MREACVHSIRHLVEKIFQAHFHYEPLFLPNNTQEQPKRKHKLRLKMEMVDGARAVHIDF